MIYIAAIAIEFFALVLGIECAYWADWKDDLADRGDDLADFCLVHIAIEFCDVDVYGVFLVFNVFHTPKGVSHTMYVRPLSGSCACIQHQLRRFSGAIASGPWEVNNWDQLCKLFKKKGIGRTLGMRRKPNQLVAVVFHGGFSGWKSSNLLVPWNPNLWHMTMDPTLSSRGAVRSLRSHHESRFWSTARISTAGITKVEFETQGWILLFCAPSCSCFFCFFHHFCSQFWLRVAG